MGFLSHLSVRAKLLASFAALCVITGIVGSLGITKLATVNTMLETMYERELRGTITVLDAKAEIAAIGREVRQIVIETDANAMKKLQDGVQERFKTAEELTIIAGDYFVSAEGKASAARVREAYPKFAAKVQEAMEFAIQNKMEEAKVPLAESRAIAVGMNADIEDLCKRKENDAKTAYEASAAAYASARTMMLGFIAGGVLLGLALGYLIARWFTKAILEVDEISNAVASASQQLAAASEQLSTGAQESASSLEETAASLEEITVTVKQNAANADQANQLASSSRDTAEKGGAVVGDAIRAMAEINQSSKRIADIITTIDEIAFQTNLLALNAAVEAARAGEQGRGFAVVAGEVRNLAQRSATAAKEIKRLIEDSVQKVEAGSRFVNQSGETLDAIVTSVKRVTDIVGEIAAASREQSAGIEQVNKAITQLDQVTQGNASQTEEMSGTAVTLSSQAEQLKTVVGQFNVSKGKTTRPSRATSFHVEPAMPVRLSSPTTVAKAPRKDKSPAKVRDTHESGELVGAGHGRDGGFVEF